MNTSPRIKSNDSIQSAIMKLCDKNEVAVWALVKLSDCYKIDPQNALGPFFPFFHLDDFEIYGEQIAILFRDICKESAKMTYTVIRAVQLGLFSLKTLKEAIENKTQIDLDDIYKKVKEQLTMFEWERK